jgi:hypothetical protein
MKMCWRIQDISELAFQVGLEYLDLSGCTGITSLVPLRELRSLQELNLRDCSAIRDLEALSDLKSLTKLDLAGCKQVVSLAPLTGLPSLKELAINSCDAIENLEPLVHLSSLKRFEALRLGTRKPLYFPKEIAQSDREIWVYGSTFTNLSDELTKPHREENVGASTCRALCGDRCPRANRASRDQNGITGQRSRGQKQLGAGLARQDPCTQGEEHPRHSTLAVAPFGHAQGR